MSGPRIGSLFSGYGGLDLAVEEFFGAETAWHCEFDAAPSKILAHHWPGVPNLGDITKVDWSQAEPVDIITGGSPCQDLSAAGRRGGMTEGTRSNLWVQMRECIAAIKPSIVVWENVRGAYSACADSEMGRCPGCVAGTGEHRPFLRALGRVLGDLSDLGFDAEVVGLRASDAGAPHGRFRVFVVAYDPVRYAGHSSGSPELRVESAGATSRPGEPGERATAATDAGRLFGRPWRDAASGQTQGRRASTDARGSGGTHAADVVAIFPKPAVADATGGHASRSGARSDEPLLPGLVRLFPTPRASDGEKGGPNQRGSKGDLTMNSAVQLLPTPVATDANGARNATANRAEGAVFNSGQTMTDVLSLLPTPTATYGGGTAEAHLARKNATGGNRDAVTGPNFIAEEFLPTLTDVMTMPRIPQPTGDAVADYEALWDALDDQSPWWVTDKGVDYWPAINRWAEVMGRKSPSPTIPDGKGGKHRLNPKFTEWMMGQSIEWITSAVIGLTRNEQLKACGNGVVTQQAVLALSIAWPRVLESLELPA